MSILIIVDSVNGMLEGFVVEESLMTEDQEILDLAAGKYINDDNLSDEELDAVEIVLLAVGYYEEEDIQLLEETKIWKNKWKAEKVNLTDNKNVPQFSRMVTVGFYP